MSISAQIKETIKSIKTLEALGFSVLPKNVSTETKSFIDLFYTRERLNSKNDLVHKNDSIYMAYDNMQKHWDMLSWPKIIAEVYVVDRDFFNTIEKSNLY